MSLRELLKKFEGESLTPYLDTEGFMTIGVGWNLDANQTPDDIMAYLEEKNEITQEMSDRLLDLSIMQADNHLSLVFPSALQGWTQNRADALLSVMFNVGLTGFLKFKKMIQAIQEGDWDRAADELLKSKRTEQVGKRAEIEANMLRIG